ncbi:hypothetical protein PN498_09825, partial [Oscillatoria sp. CS-180]|uniref:hypothetical protein n=1 Tax=Oscillatoria sp. CS-180 TaxID=3021720 RepID=UPI00232ADEAA
LSAGQVSSIAKALSLQGHSTIGLVVWFGALTACGCSAGTTLFVQNQGLTSTTQKYKRMWANRCPQDVGI